MYFSQMYDYVDKAFIRYAASNNGGVGKQAILMLDASTSRQM